MNRLVDGEWRTDLNETTDDDGRFQRSTTRFRDWIAGSDVPTHVESVANDTEPSSRFQPEAGRYHLYVSLACPWAHRALATRTLRGLEETIEVSVVDPWRGADGWQFSPDKEGCTRDKARDSEYLRELYIHADPEANGRVTVPVLWDTKHETIVNNESREIIRMLDTAFDEYADPDSRLLPESPADIREVDQLITDIYEPINNGVYRAGFATSQTAYDQAVEELFDALDHWNEVLADQRFLAGDQLTEADICMFTTLVRFDAVYHTHFMCNQQFIHQYDNLWPYLRDIYQTGSVAETVNMDQIKEHYYTTHPSVTPTGIVATGPNPDLETPHERAGMTDASATPADD
ncbi:MAG: putative glutathione S-transferase [Halorubrum sp. J07HR59]|nr:MAG: putative glutathione S-transferase [Halorubrum sp. J07HR59]